MAAKAVALRFTRVKLTNWRNFRSAEVSLGRRAFLVGPNASGKSNFLDALRFLRDIAKPIGGGLAAALDARDGLTKVRCRNARKPSYVEIDVDVGTDDDPKKWGYRVRFNRVSGEKSVTIAEEEVRIPGNESPVFRKRHAQESDPLAYTQTLLEQVAQTKPFRPLVEFFGTIRYLHVVPQIVRDPRRARTDIEDPFGGDLLRRMNELPNKSLAPRLRKLAAALEVAVPQFSNLELDVDAEGKPHLLASYKYWRPHATKHDEAMFSDGTLRLIGFLWSIAEKGGPLLLEEPELSLNEAVASELPAMIARMQRVSARQVIATTHSYAMLAAKGVGLDEVHRFAVGENGTTVETARDNAVIVAQVASGLPVSEAVLALTKPRDAGSLATMSLVDG